MLQILDLDRTALERARISRDPRFDGKFFIAVTSTGIYCRPVCPSPTSKSCNVEYYPTAVSAAEAGFRPCLRCRPETAPGTPAWTGTSSVVRRALRLIEGGALDDDSVSTLASRVGVGPRHLDRLFVQYVGASPLAVAQTRRLQFAKHLLDETDLPVTQIALAAGFGSIRRFNAAFQKTYARPPRELRKKTTRTAARDEVVLKLAYRPPYQWNSICNFLARRALPGVELVDANSYTRTVALSTGPAIITVRPLESQDALELRVRGAPPSALFQLSATARRMFDLASDPAAIAAMFKPDPLLGPMLRTLPGLRIAGAWDPFECTVRAVLGQQVSVAAGRTFAARLVARAGTQFQAGPEGLTHLFPSPAQLEAADLTGLGITTSRTDALRAMARAVLEGKLDFKAPAPDVVAALTAIPGLGEWTAQYVSLRALGEPDAFLDGDLVLRKVAGSGGTPLAVRALAARAESWRPWRGYAVMYLWESSSAPRAHPEAAPRHSSRSVARG